MSSRRPVAQAAIQKRQAELVTETPSKGDVSSLVAEADAAIALARAEGNAGALVAALQLKARLMGVLQGNELAPEPPPAASHEELSRALFQHLQAQGVEFLAQKKAWGESAKNDGDPGTHVECNGRTSDTPSEIIDTTDGGTVISITDVKQIRKWDAERVAQSTPALPANTKTFSTGFSWRKRYDAIINRDVFDLFDAAGSHCGTRQSRARADTWCEQEGVV